MIVEVKRKHILNGKAGQPDNCPIALAVKEHFPDNNVDVDDGEITIDYSHDWKRYKITKECEKFIDKFDNGKKVKPFKFRLLKSKY